MPINDPNALQEPLATVVRYALWRSKLENKNLYIVSGVRTVAEQEDLRKKHCAKDPNNATDYEIYSKPSRQCTPPTAPPGKSKHQTGRAVDMGGSKDWMANIVRKFDVIRNVPGEDWHFEYKGSRSVEQIKSAVARDALAFGAGPSTIQSLTSTPPGTRTPLSDLKGAASTVTDVVTAPIDLAKGIYTVLTDVNTWIRVAKVVGGAALVIIGLQPLLGDTLTNLTPAKVLK